MAKTQGAQSQGSMTQAQGFKVGLTERKVELIASQDGREHKLTHILRYPSSAEWIEYDRLVNEVKFKGRKTQYKSRVLEARIHLYDKLVTSVEGYWDAETNQPLTIDKTGWQDKIPALHKSEVIGSFGEVSPAEEDEVKN